MLIIKGQKLNITLYISCPLQKHAHYPCFTLLIQIIHDHDVLRRSPKPFKKYYIPTFIDFEDFFMVLMKQFNMKVKFCHSH